MTVGDNFSTMVNPISIRWKKIRRWLAIVLLIAFVGCIVGSWLVGGSLVKPANRVVGKPPQDLPVVETTLPSESGSNIATWYIPKENAIATVILLHRIRSDRRSMLSRARVLREAGFSIVMIDFQAHGESPGEMITAGHRESHDVRAAVEFVREKSESPNWDRWMFTWRGSDVDGIAFGNRCGGFRSSLSNNFRNDS